MLIYLVLIILFLILLFTFYYYYSPFNVVTSSLSHLPTLEQRVETLEICGDEHYKCEDVIAYTKKGIELFQKNDISTWQKLAEDNIQDKYGLYWFVMDPNGYEFVLGGTPNYQPSNIYDLRDETGKYPVREIIDKANQGGGWVSYYWYIDPNTEPGVPEDELVKVKHSYVAPFEYQGKEYIIGAGIYLFPGIEELNRVCQAESTIAHCDEQLFPYCRRVMERVDTVASLFREYGSERALEILKEQRANFTNEELFIYANNFSGDVLFNSLNPSAEGSNVADSECFQEAIRKLNICSAGWNRCTFGETTAQGYDVDVSDCPSCPPDQRIIIGSSFNLPSSTEDVPG